MASDGEVRSKAGGRWGGGGGGHEKVSPQGRGEKTEERQDIAEEGVKEGGQHYFSSDVKARDGTGRLS